MPKRKKTDEFIAHEDMNLTACYLALRNLESQLLTLLRHNVDADPDVLLHDIRCLRESVEKQIPLETEHD